MEPQIRYCTSADGTRIAYSVRGDERTLPPYVFIHGWFIALEWLYGRADFRRHDDSIAAIRRVIRPEWRGHGASQRDVADVSLEALVADLAAIVESLRLTRFELGGAGEGASVAEAYAARHPEHVSKLWLFGSSIGPYSLSPEGAHSLVELVNSNWSMARRIMASRAFPDGPIEAQRAHSAMLRESLSPEVAARYIEFLSNFDINDALPRIQAPTTIAWLRSAPSTRRAHAVAALIPDVRLVPLEGSSGLIFTDQFTQAEVEFLGEGAAPRAAQAPSGTAVILFADIAESTALTERLGDAAFRERSRALDGAVREAVRASGGTPVEGKVMGDGVMAVFASARQAIDAALRCREASAQHELPLHLGLHAGDVIREGDNVYGGAVNVAARICDASGPGEILVSETVRGLARTSAGVAFEDRGERPLKGIDEPQRLYAVVAQED